MTSRFFFNEVVLQPTSLCNLNCSYCYVPYRDEDRRMQPEVATHLAASLEKLPKHEHPISLLWHCGEPLAVGTKHMRALYEPFEELRQSGQIVHRMQTNGTLVDRAWCDFFIEYNVEIAVSLDGPPAANKHRLHWNGTESFEKTMRGIERLREIGCEPVVLTVVTEDRLDSAAELYDFFVKIGCVRLGINIEERSGVNLVRPMVREAKVERFWKELHAAHVKNPAVCVRELQLFEEWWQATKGVVPPSEEQRTYKSNYLPTVGYDGGVVFLSPELLNCNAGAYGTFEVGNITRESFDEIIRKAKKTPYLLDYLAGIDACKASCPYYNFCGGGFATNKFFELGTMNGTATRSCLNVRKKLFDAMMKVRAEELAFHERHDASDVPTCAIAE